MPMRKEYGEGKHRKSPISFPMMIGISFCKEKEKAKSCEEELTKYRLKQLDARRNYDRLHKLQRRKLIVIKLSIMNRIVMKRNGLQG